jgi:hypothetical protein
MVVTKEKKVLSVGLIMPISPIDGCTAEHWADIKSILIEAVDLISEYTCTTKIVSEADDVGVIQKRIVQNIYSSDIVICDVSCKNANVMFELGMRLAFDKPTIIIKDDATNYTFDTGIIEHIEYPRDLRFTKIVEFKNKLARKILATYEEFLNNPDQSTFLKNFGEFKVATLTETAVTPDNLILDMLTEIQSDVAVLKRDQNREKSIYNSNSNISADIVYNANFKRHVRHALNQFIDRYKLKYDSIDETHNTALINYVEESLKNTSYGSVPQTIIVSALGQVLYQINNKVKEVSV